MLNTFIFLNIYFILDQIELQIEVENATFEVSQLLLDKLDKSDEFTNENENTNTLLATFSDLHYIINQKLIS